MNVLRGGSDCWSGDAESASRGGVDGGVGGRCLFVCDRWASQRITADAFSARYDTMAGETGIMMNWSSAAWFRGMEAMTCGAVGRATAGQGELCSLL